MVVGAAAGPAGPMVGAAPAAAAAALAAEREIRKCPLCWEEQPYLAERRGRTTATDSAMIRKVQDFRKIIFRFEEVMRGKVHDAVIFHGMLGLRRDMVEGWLRHHGYRFVPWTLHMLKRHYDPNQGHRLDLVRELAQELQDARQMRQWIMQHAMFVPNVDAGVGAPPIFNVRAVDPRLKVGKHLLDTAVRLNTEVTRRDTEHATDARLILDSVNGAVNRLTGVLPGAGAGAGAGAAANRAIDEDDPLALMYDVGGM